MAKKSKGRGGRSAGSVSGDGRRRRPDRAQQVAHAGAAAALLGALAFFVGPMTWQNAWDWAKTILIAGGLALAFRWGIAEPYKIPSGSMEPTLHGDPGFGRGDRVFVNKWKYGLRYPFMNKRIYYGASPQRFDIVVFKSVEEDPLHSTLVKRIVGMPGERVHIANGKVHVDGEPLEMPPELQDVTYTSNQAGMRYGVLESDRYAVVPEGCYLLLGDNSASSRDGRFFGWTPNEHLLGPVTCIWWPPARWRDFTGFTQTWWWRGLLTVLGIYAIWRLFVGRSVRIVDVSPDPALQPGDHVYVNRLAFGLPVPFSRMRLTSGRAPRRGELVVYHHPDPSPEMDGRLLLGRVVGLPGETISFEDDVPHVNGTPVDAPGVAGRRYPAIEGAPPYGRSVSKEYSTTPEGQYFVLSDEAGEEPDGRTLGWTPRALLVGVATHVWRPIKRAGKIPG